jgi:hypothetical protein
MTVVPAMRWLLRTAVFASVTLLLVPVAAGAAPTLFRIFLTDGSDVVSYGEYARVGNDVILSLAVGRAGDEPRLQLITLPGDRVDWSRTERYSDAARADHYASTRGDEDFAQLSNEVARVLNEIAVSTDRTRALALAERAHDVLAKWPEEHYRYRESEVRDILSIVDSAIASLRGEPGPRFDLALVATARDIPAEPLQGMPSPQLQLTQLVHVADLMPRAADRVSLLQAALSMLDDSTSVLPVAEASVLRTTLAGRIDHEQDVDARYARLSQRLTADATRAAQAARAGEVEHVLARVATEDRKLGGERPETVQALRAILDARLNDARRLRLLRDQWIVRRSAYQEYQQRVGLQMVQLVKAQPLLDAIRRLDGPAPDRLVALKARLAGGADRLQRLEVPPELRTAHDLLVGAWRFAENATAARYDAVKTGDVSTAWTASSAAAGSLMLLSRAQADLRTLLEIPRLK